LSHGTKELVIVAVETKQKKQAVRLLALNLNERDLSIGLVGLRQYAELDETVRSNYDFHLHQWNKDYANKGKPGTVDGLDISKLVDSLDPENTAVFGFSTYIWNMDFMLAVATEVKRRNPEAVTVFGGSQAGGYGARFLEEYPCADFVISGEAEHSFRRFLLSLLDGDLNGVDNLYYRDGDAVKKNVPDDHRAAKQQSYLDRIDDLPYAFRDPEYRAFLDELDYQVTAQFETERGCPLSCAFCSWGTRLPIRRRDQSDVEEGLTYLLNHPNVRAVYIVDANPFIKNEKGLWLTDYLVNKNKTGKPVFFELNPEYVKDPQVIENLGKLAGDELAFGLQSTSDHTLKIIKRKFNRDIYERNVRRLTELNPDANIKFSLILGLPGDTLDTFLNSLDFVISMSPKDVYVHDLLVLPGSEMYGDPESFGLEVTHKPPHRLIRNKTFLPDAYDRAKFIGYYVKLLHKFKWLKKAMLALREQVGGRSVDLYARLADTMEAEGLHGVEGRQVRESSTEEFDFLTNQFVENAAKSAALEDLFERFEASELDALATGKRPGHAASALEQRAVGDEAARVRSEPSPAKKPESRRLPVVRRSDFEV
jgi:radical SAM superfamily enzyme YgiQ (UPF0313 family)